MTLEQIQGGVSVCRIRNIERGQAVAGHNVRIGAVLEKKRQQFRSAR